MPHSSGGGSHGGGSHGGGGHSSSGSSGFSLLGNGRRQVGKNYFTGAKRYVRYGDNGVEYVYANRDITQRLSSPERYKLLLFYLPFFIAVIKWTTDIINVPVKITSSYENEIIIKDNIDIFRHEDELENQLKEFQDVTGVTPYILTVYNKDWNDYSSLEDFAYDYYVENIKDEYHWLIVYSEPKVVEDFNDWYWEGMQGDDTDRILDEVVTAEFTEDLQNRFMTDRNASVDQSIKASFAKITPNIMKMHINKLPIVKIIVVGIFVLPHCYIVVFFDPNKKYRGFVLDSTDSDLQSNN